MAMNDAASELSCKDAKGPRRTDTIRLISLERQNPRAGDH